MFFLFYLSFCYSQDKIPVDNLIVKNDKIYEVLVSTISKNVIKGNIEDYCCIIQIIKRRKEYELLISGMKKKQFSIIINDVSDSLWGCFIYEDIDFIIFGEKAKKFFQRKKEKHILPYYELINMEKIRKEYQNQIPISVLYEPNVFVYLYKKNKFVFKYGIKGGILNLKDGVSISKPIID